MIATKGFDMAANLELLWNGVVNDAKVMLSSTFTTHKFMMKADPDSKRCFTLGDYTILLAAQRSIDEFMHWETEYYDAFLLQHYNSLQASAQQSKC